MYSSTQNKKYRTVYTYVCVYIYIYAYVSDLPACQVPVTIPPDLPSHFRPYSKYISI